MKTKRILILLSFSIFLLSAKLTNAQKNRFGIVLNSGYDKFKLNSGDRIFRPPINVETFVERETYGGVLFAVGYGFNFSQLQYAYDQITFPNPVSEAYLYYYRNLNIFNKYFNVTVGGRINRFNFRLGTQFVSNVKVTDNGSFRILKLRGVAPMQLNDIRSTNDDHDFAEFYYGLGYTMTQDIDFTFTFVHVMFYDLNRPASAKYRALFGARFYIFTQEIVEYKKI